MSVQPAWAQRVASRLTLQIPLQRATDENNPADLDSIEATAGGGTSFLIPPLTGQDPYGRPPKDLDLSACIRAAIESATQILMAQNNIELSGAQLLQAYGQFLPNLSATASYNYQGGTVFFATAAPTLIETRSAGITYLISSTLNLFNGFNDYHLLKASLARKEASELTLDRAKQQIALDVAQAYLQVILDQELIRIGRKNLRSSRTRQRLLSAQTKVGLRSLSDLFRQQALTSSDQLGVSRAENQERVDQLKLLERVRLSPDFNYVLTRPPLDTQPQANPLYQDEARLIQTALANRSDLKSAHQLADAAEHDVHMFQSNYLPKLDFGFSATANARHLFTQTVAGLNMVPRQQAGYFDQLHNQANYTVGLNLSWTFFDRFATRLNIARARRDAQNAEIQLNDQQRVVISEIRQAYGYYRTSLQQLDSSRIGLRAAEKAFEVMQGRYEVGSANFVDLVSAQTALVQAEANQAQAIINFTLQERTMSNVLGQLPVD